MVQTANKNAIPAAKKLLEYLYEIFGKIVVKSMKNWYTYICK